VKIGHVEVPEVRQYADGRFGFDDYSRGTLKKIRRKSAAKARGVAIESATLIARGRTDLLDITREELAEVRRLRDARTRSIRLSEGVSLFLEAKRLNRELNRDYVENFRYHLQPFVDRLGHVPVSDLNRDAQQLVDVLDALNKTARTRNNIRDALSTLFRFLRARGFLPEGKTAGEQIERVKVKRREDIGIYTPEQTERALNGARPWYRKQIALGAFAGIRSEESRPKKRSRKDPLCWEDFYWQQGYIDIRPETSKTGIPRQVPILPALKAWLWPVREARGVVVPFYSPYEERQRLEKDHGVPRLKNGWRKTYATYRMAMIQNMQQLTEELGNTPSIARRNYQRPRARAIAKRYFASRPPAGAGKIIEFQKSAELDSSKQRLTSRNGIALPAKRIKSAL
jgi:hypothetical protein